MVIRDARLKIDDRQCEYEFASVAFLPMLLSIHRVEQGHLDHWFIRDPGPHFSLAITPDLVLAAFKASGFEQHFEGDLGAMRWYQGAGGRDGTGWRGVSSLDVTADVSSSREHFDMHISGTLIDKEQIIFGALPPPRHRRFDLPLSLPLDSFLEFFEHCPEFKERLSEALARV